MIKYLLSDDNREFNSGKRPHKGPLPHGYKPDLDVMDECDAKHVSRFQQLIGVLRWAVQLGSIDIQVEVPLLSQYQAFPKEVHLEALYLIFHFLSNNPKKILVMDPIIPNIDGSVFNNNTDLKYFYGDVVEKDPHQITEPLGRPVYFGCLIDADHVGNVITRRLHSGILFFVNRALIKSFSKRQNTIKLSMFGSDLVVLRIERCVIVEIRIKLKVFGVPLDGLENLFCDNTGVVKNTSIPGSTLSKKHNTINYHCMSEASTFGILCLRKEDTATNLANPLTKLIPFSRKQELLGCLLYGY